MATKGDDMTDAHVCEHVVYERQSQRIKKAAETIRLGGVSRVVQKYLITVARAPLYTGPDRVFIRLSDYMSLWYIKLLSLLCMTECMISQQTGEVPQDIAALPLPVMV
jgi:hypothetical protein